jgi:hypothetical protein
MVHRLVFRAHRQSVETLASVERDLEGEQRVAELKRSTDPRLVALVVGLLAPGRRSGPVYRLSHHARTLEAFQTFSLVSIASSVTHIVLSMTFMAIVVRIDNMQRGHFLGSLQANEGHLPHANPNTLS